MYDNSFACKNGIFNYKKLGVFNSSNIESLFTDYLSNENGRVGYYFTLQDGVHNCDWMIAGINSYFNMANQSMIGEHYVVITKNILNNANPNSQYGTTASYMPMNSTSTAGVSQNELNPLYNDRIDPDTGETIPGTHGVETAGKQAFYGSDMYQLHIPMYINNMRGLLGNHMMQFNDAVSCTLNMTASSSGFSNWPGAVEAMLWNYSYMTLMSEIQVYGANVFSSSGYDTGMACSKLPIFNFINHTYFAASGRHSFWLKGVAAKSKFCAASGAGLASCYGANDIYRSVRPLMLFRK